MAAPGGEGCPALRTCAGGPGETGITVQPARGAFAGRGQELVCPPAVDEQGLADATGPENVLRNSFAYWAGDAAVPIVGRLMVCPAGECGLAPLDRAAPEFALGPRAPAFDAALHAIAWAGSLSLLMRGLEIGQIARIGLGEGRA